MSHCRNITRRIKYFCTVAFLSVWKKILPFGRGFAGLPAASPNGFLPASEGEKPLGSPPAAGSPLLCISGYMYDKFDFI